MNIEEIRARLAEILTERRSMHEGAGDRNLTEDEQVRWDALDSEEARLNADLAAEQERMDRAARVAESRARYNSIQVSPTRTDQFNLEGLSRMNRSQIEDRARAAFSEARNLPRGIDSAHVDELLRKIDTVPGVAEHALVHGSPAYRSAFEAWFEAGCRGTTPVLTGEEAMAVRASMSLTSANGGYVLPTLLDPTLIHTGTATSNPVRRIARVETGTQDKWRGVTAGAVTTYWKGEGSAFTDGTGTFGGITVDAAMLTAYVTASFEIFQDSNLQVQLPGLIGEAIDYAEGTAFVSGSGSDAPKGIITAISATAGCTVTATTRGSFTTASMVDTLALLNSVATRFEDSSTWLMNKATYRTIGQQMVGTGAVKAIEMTDRNNLMDLPVVRASDMPSATTSGNCLIVLGDFSRFIIYDRIGVNVEFIANVVDGDGLPVGKRGLVAYKRVGSDVADLNAFRFLKA